MRYNRTSRKKSLTGKLIKLGILAIICLICYAIGWGNGQASVYHKMQNETELYK